MLRSWRAEGGGAGGREEGNEASAAREDEFLASPCPCDWRYPSRSLDADRWGRQSKPLPGIRIPYAGGCRLAWQARKIAGVHDSDEDASPCHGLGHDIEGRGRAEAMPGSGCWIGDGGLKRVRRRERAAGGV